MVQTTVQAKLNSCVPLVQRPCSISPASCASPLLIGTAPGWVHEPLRWPPMVGKRLLLRPRSVLPACAGERHHRGLFVLRFNDSRFATYALIRIKLICRHSLSIRLHECAARAAAMNGIRISLQSCRAIRGAYLKRVSKRISKRISKVYGHDEGF
jgi:hypothetical protein